MDKLMNEKLRRLLEAYLVETDTAIKFKLNYQIQEAKKDIDRFGIKLDAGNAKKMAAYEKTLAGDSGTVAVESAPAPQASHQREIFISYAWGGESEVMADRIEQALVAREIPLIRDKRNLGFKGRIRDFMREIGRGKAVIVIISDKYLKSENCMFELIEIAKNGDFYDRIFPIVLEDAQIYKPVARLNYIKYWEHEITALDEAMKDVNAANLQGIRESMDLYTEIRATMSRLVDILADMNALTPETHTESGFAELIAAIEAKINE